MKRSNKWKHKQFTKADLGMYLEAIKTKAAQDNKECNEHIQQVTDQNAMLMVLVQEQQKKIKELWNKVNIYWEQWTKGNRNQKPTVEQHDNPETPKSNGAHTAKKGECTEVKFAFP